jgi:hypothetical protein
VCQSWETNDCGFYAVKGLCQIGCRDVRPRAPFAEHATMPNTRISNNLREGFSAPIPKRDLVPGASELDDGRSAARSGAEHRDTTHTA